MKWQEFRWKLWKSPRYPNRLNIEIKSYYYNYYYYNTHYYTITLYVLHLFYVQKPKCILISMFLITMVFRVSRIPHYLPVCIPSYDTNVKTYLNYAEISTIPFSNILVPSQPLLKRNTTTDWVRIPMVVTQNLNSPQISRVL